MLQSVPILPNVMLHGNKPSTVLTETVQHPLAECQAFLDFFLSKILFILMCPTLPLLLKRTMLYFCDIEAAQRNQSKNVPSKTLSC